LCLTWALRRRLQDLKLAMPTLWRSLQQLLDFEGDVAALALSFEVGAARGLHLRFPSKSAMGGAAATCIDGDLGLLPSMPMRLHH
jgi:hypothetical protein